jgi:hypothetical protein
MQYIRDAYKVPAKRGGRVRFLDSDGVITGTVNGLLRIRIRGFLNVNVHPTDARLEYLTEVSHEQ